MDVIIRRLRSGRRGRVALTVTEVVRSCAGFSRDYTKMKLFNRVARRIHSRDRKRTVRLGIERFEDRFLLATFLVTTAADNGDNVNPTANSLRAGILSGNDTILFAIPSGPFVISP